MKFGGNRLLLDGFVEVKSKEEADEVPLAKVLYDEFKFVKKFCLRKFCGSNQR